MQEEPVRWSSMQGAPGEESRRVFSAMQIQEQIIRQAQDTLVAARDANAAAAEEHTMQQEADTMRSRAFGPAQAQRAAQRFALSSTAIQDSTLDSSFYEPNSPDDPNDPENRLMNPGAGVGSYGSMLSPSVKPTLPPDKAIPQLFERMKAYKGHLTAILRACLTECSTSEVNDAVEPEYEFCKCAFSPIALRKMLVEAGALAYLDPEDKNDKALDESEQTSDGAPLSRSDNEINGEIPFITEDNTDEVIDELEDFTSNRDDEELEDERLRGSVYDRLGYLVIEDEPEGTWLTTEEGRDYLESIDPEREFHQQVEEHSNVEDVFYDILAYCEQGRNITDIVKRFENDSRLGVHTFYASRLVDKMEQAGVLIWKKNWIITEAGRKLLNEWRSK
ncbi:hypothetical protein [Adlercreutzia sp. ZJ138]|uniref:hypothetical protein n=1 Tax=Adlercreutzia sp. ZJ138 TaxID=2709405 RepID=UPI0013ED881D|nr:hypothetical protein [Adlercreutzia sp. ZJ138]